MFPATIDTHYTFGIGKKLNKTTEIIASFVYAPKKENVVKPAATSSGKVITKHSQKSLTLALKYKF